MRHMLAFSLVVLGLVPVVASAQVHSEVRPFVGMFLPTGDQRDTFKDAVLTGGQLALEAADVVHFVGTFAFSSSDFRSGIRTSGHMHIYQADVGGELFRDVALNDAWRFRPFVGLGAGARIYDPTGTASTRTYPAGYGALGAEFQWSPFAMRLEARDYLSRFKGVTGDGKASARNDILLNAGLAFHFR